MASAGIHNPCTGFSAIWRSIAVLFAMTAGGVALLEEWKRATPYHTGQLFNFAAALIKASLNPLQRSKQIALIRGLRKST
jgi:hypothetical protein